MYKQLGIYFGFCSWDRVRELSITRSIFFDSDGDVFCDAQLCLSRATVIGAVLVIDVRVDRLANNHLDN